MSNIRKVFAWLPVETHAHKYLRNGFAWGKFVYDYNGMYFKLFGDASLQMSSDLINEGLHLTDVKPHYKYNWKLGKAERVL